MSENYWEEEVFSVSPLAYLERIDDSKVFSWLEGHLPFSAGKIDWSRVVGRHQHWRIDDERLLAESASREIRARIKSGSVVEHVGDGLSPYGVRFTESEVDSVTVALLEVPEHHYFLAEDRSWVVVVSFEGDLDVLDRASA
ncbi:MULTISPECIES: hypothetical protein [Saccharomonospora]|uniref:hypothetical protein n=1 Tax=Saccharomonospora TaxID=1851 RepID=UPI0008F2B33D|nr:MULTISPECIES: hypothetical protein [Saccharomonospora]SFP55548.1 hypothetical protein SAMN02982918_2614 [Saccharomonospora viridis]